MAQKGRAAWLNCEAHISQPRADVCALFRGLLPLSHPPNRRTLVFISCGPAPTSGASLAECAPDLCFSAPTPVLLQPAGCPTATLAACLTRVDVCVATFAGPCPARAFAVACCAGALSQWGISHDNACNGSAQEGHPRCNACNGQGPHAF
jgi:hypothetical protein